MKKFIAIFLIVTMCFSLTACISGQEKIFIEENGTIWFPTEKSFREHVKKVEITKDNWQEYFEDYEKVEHIVEKNDFGDIEKEYDEITFEFRFKKGTPMLLNSASFKFDGKTTFYYDYDTDHYIEKYKANHSTYEIFDYKSKEFIEERNLTGTGIKEYYLVEMDNPFTLQNSHYTEYNCIDATGTVYVFDLPEGIYNGQKLNKMVMIGRSCAIVEEFDKFLEE